MLASAHDSAWCRNMSHNNLTGNLPSNWGVTGSFTQLTVLDLSFNAELAGGLPPLWGTWGAFPHLQTLSLAMTGLSGQLPQAWGYQTSFPALQMLDLAGNLLQGMPLVLTQRLCPALFVSLLTGVAKSHGDQAVVCRLSCAACCRVPQALLDGLSSDVSGAHRYPCMRRQPAGRLGNCRGLQ